MRNSSVRILAEGQLMSNDTWATGINNNDLVIGPSGAGKTRGYVKPNLLQCSDSVIVADTKGSLIHEVGPGLESRGYKVVCLDFTGGPSSCGYNPLDFIHYDRRTKSFSEQDIMTVAAHLIPLENQRDPFWELSARMYIASMIGYVLECLPKKEHTLEYVAALFQEMSTGNFRRLYRELGHQNPDSFAYRKYRMFCDSKTAEKTFESIRMVLAQNLDPLIYSGPIQMYRSRNRIDFKSLGREKTAVFLTISDTDRSADKLVTLFYAQALGELCASADQDYPDHRLPVPVRLILDDFATNAYISDFDKTISVIRSREIYVSIILQSISQLEALYGHAKAMTIINNCDNCLYLGGQDVETARYIGAKANRTADSILNMPLGQAYLFTRGKAPQKVQVYDIRTHEGYKALPEAQGEAPEAWAGKPAAALESAPEPGDEMEQ